MRKDCGGIERRKKGFVTVKLTEQLQIPFCVVQFRIPVYRNEVYNRKWKAAEKRYGLYTSSLRLFFSVRAGYRVEAANLPRGGGGGVRTVC